MRTMLLVLLSCLPLWSQVPLLETPQTLHCTVSMELTGVMKLDRNGRVEDLPITARGKHVYLEQGRIRKYLEAQSQRVNAIERHTVTLPEAHRMVALEEGQPVSPGGPLTRDEYSLVAEHFPAAKVGSLLPGRNVTIGESWAMSDSVAASLCLFEGVIKNDLQAKLEAVNDGIAVIMITGKVEGLEAGAKVTTAITARGEFDLRKNLLTRLTWEQTDQRDAGPVSPILEAKVRIILQRETSPETLNAPKIDPRMRLLIHRDPDGKFEITADRDWHTVTQAPSHLVLRLVRKNELIAQATITPWKKREANSIADFEAAILKQPGWQPGKTLNRGGENPFLLTASGTQDGVAVVQTFALVAGPDGRQAVMACVVRPELVGKLAGGDAQLAAGLSVPPGK